MIARFETQPVKESSKDKIYKEIPFDYDIY